MQVFLDGLSTVFVVVLNMSITASVMIVFVLLARLCLKRVPRSFSYALWAVVLFRLLCPVSFASPVAVLSLFGTAPAAQTPTNTMQYVSPDAVENSVRATDELLMDYQSSVEDAQSTTASPDVEQEDTHDVAQDGIVVAGTVQQADAVGGDAAQGIALDAWVIAALVWVVGALVLLGVNAYSLLRLKQKLRRATCYSLEECATKASSRVYQSEVVPTAFVLGIWRPCIFLPAHLSLREQSYVLRHERIHIARRDPLWQSIAFVALCLHWFNPLVWLAFKANQKDMEASCDERVLRQMGSGIKAEYAQSLLNLSHGKVSAFHTALTFGESSTKSRIRNVLLYRKPVVWVSSAAAIALAVAVVLLVANPAQTGDDGVYADDYFTVTAGEDWQIIVNNPDDVEIISRVDDAYRMHITRTASVTAGTSGATDVERAYAIIEAASLETAFSSSVTLNQQIDGYNASVTTTNTGDMQDYLECTTYMLIVDGMDYTVTTYARYSEGYATDAMLEQELNALVNALDFAKEEITYRNLSLTEMVIYEDFAGVSFAYPEAWNISIYQMGDAQSTLLFDENANLAYNKINFTTATPSLGDAEYLSALLGASVTDMDVIDFTLAGNEATQATYHVTLNGERYCGQWIVIGLAENSCQISLRYHYSREQADVYENVLDNIIATLGIATEDTLFISEQMAMDTAYAALVESLQDNSVRYERFIEEGELHTQEASLTIANTVEGEPFWTVTIYDVATESWDALTLDWYRVSYNVKVNAVTNEMISIMGSR